ncbi:MAG: DUF4912 domain-containing protein [bacterium]
MEWKDKNLKNALKKDLISFAKEAFVKGYSKMTRLELIESLSNLKNFSISGNKNKPATAQPQTPDTAKPPEQSAPIQHTSLVDSISVPLTQEHEAVSDKYGINRIVLMVRDPFWIYTYWEITPEHDAYVKGTIDVHRCFDARIVLRVLDVTEVDADSTNSFNYIQINSDARNWYLHVPKSNRLYCVEIGYLCSNGEFYRLSRSNSVRTPRAGMSNVFDERWMSIEDYDKLYVLSGGLGVGLSSMNLMKKKNEVLHREYYSGSGGISDIDAAEPNIKTEFLYRNIHTELIIYGTAEPGSSIQIGGINKKVKQDGNFSIRFHLNSGEHPIPIRVKSPDGTKEETYKIVVTKENGK